MSGDILTIKTKWGQAEEKGRWLQLSFYSALDCLPCCTLAISLIGKSNLLERLCFLFLRTAFQSLNWNNDREDACLDGGGKITCDSQEACLPKSTRLMRCLPPKHSAVAKGCEMWLITALELWLTGAHCQHMHGQREACGAASARSSNSMAPFCCLQMILALPAAHLDNSTSTEHALGMWSFGKQNGK